MGDSLLEILPNKNQLGKIRFPRAMVQGKYKIAEKYKIKIVDKNGNTSYRNPTTIVDEKIADTCIQIFQSSSLAKEMDYKILRNKAEASLESRFKKYNMIVDESHHNRTDALLIKKKREIAIHQWIRNYIENNLDFTFYVDYDKFIAMTGIKSASRIGYALTMISETKAKASYEYKISTISEDFSVIDYEYKIVQAIPEIGIILDEEMGQKYEKLADFIKADIKNKKKHIKKISFQISKSYISAILGLGRDYTETNRKQRDMFKTTYAFRLDPLIKSIVGIQNSQTLNRFTFEDIKEILGSNISDYRLFKKNVLLPAINDLNLYTDFNIELVETRLSKKIDFVSFNIHKKQGIDYNLKYGVDRIAYYIASRIYYFTVNKLENLIGYAVHIEQQMKEENLLTMYENKYVSEWRIEAEKEYKIEEELLKFIEANKRIFDAKNIVYDEKRLCIVEQTITYNKELVDSELFPGEKMEKEGKKEKKIKLLRTIDYTVNNPSSSLKYIHEVILKDTPQEATILQFVPFYISTGKKSFIPINDLDDYIKYHQLIQYNIVEKNLSFFSFDEKHETKDIFYSLVLEGRFREITSEFREMVKSICNYNIDKPLIA